MRDNARELIVLMVFVFMLGVFLVWEDVALGQGHKRERKVFIKTAIFNCFFVALARLTPFQTG